MYKLKWTVDGKSGIYTVDSYRKTCVLRQEKTYKTAESAEEAAKKLTEMAPRIKYEVIKG